MPSLRVLLLDETAGPGGSGHGGKLVSQVSITVLLSWTSQHSFSVLILLQGPSPGLLFSSSLPEDYTDGLSPALPKCVP